MMMTCRGMRLDPGTAAVKLMDVLAIGGRPRPDGNETSARAMPSALGSTFQHDGPARGGVAKNMSMSTDFDGQGAEALAEGWPY